MAPRTKSPSPAKSSTPTSAHEPLDATPEPAAKAKQSGPTVEEIARRAYEIYQARGGEHGRHEEDWHQAERELKLGPQ